MPSAEDLFEDEFVINGRLGTSEILNEPPTYVLILSAEI